MPNRLIAIVDDEKPMVDLLSTYLKMRGYQIVSAYSGIDAIPLVQQERPDALLLDLMLPTVDGLTICELLRRDPDFGSLPIIIVTARNDQQTMARAERVGADAFLTKPVSFPRLQSLLLELLGD
ncbi:MAG: response regulator [Chloroflexi bacterium]|jgi:CheY-like chemotaxis protein|nr:response regulator [Chloroflexota bacterium]